MKQRKCLGTVTPQRHGSKPLTPKRHNDAKRAMLNMEGSSKIISIQRNFWFCGLSTEMDKGPIALSLKNPKVPVNEKLPYRSSLKVMVVKRLSTLTHFIVGFLSFLDIYNS